jgi:hypothetical protein
VLFFIGGLLVFYDRTTEYSLAELKK